MDEKTFNKDFIMMPDWMRIPLSKEEIISILSNDYNIYREFRKVGLIDSRKYNFITKVTFGKNEKNQIDGLKNMNEVKEAEEKLRCVEEYFNNIYGEEGYFKVEFASRKDDECALYNENRFTNYYKLNEELKRRFDM